MIFYIYTLQFVEALQSSYRKAPLKQNISLNSRQIHDKIQVPFQSSNSSRSFLAKLFGATFWPKN